MPNNCSIFGCFNTRRKTAGSNIRYFRFPKGKEFQQRWIHSCSRADYINPENAQVCSVHFADSDYKEDLKSRLLGLKVHPQQRILKDDAVPSLCLPQGDVEPGAHKLKPAKRGQKRVLADGEPALVSDSRDENSEVKKKKKKKKQTKRMSRKEMQHQLQMKKQRKSLLKERLSQEKENPAPEIQEPKEDAEPDVIVKTEPIDDYCDRESQLMENIKLESEDADEFLDIKVEPEEDPFANDSTQDLALADLVQTQSTPTTSQLLSCRKTKNVDQEANKYMVFPGNSTCYSSVMLTSDAHTQETFEGGGGGRDDKAAGQKGTMVVVGLVSSENDSKEENSRVLPESHKQATEEVQKGKKKNTWGRKVFKNVDESLVAISSAGYNADEYKVFGEYVAQTLRSMNRPDLFRKVKIEINEILLGAISECLPHIKPKPKSKT